ncbi:serine O-acetyltransferase [Arthrobacter sp. SLBN-83]|uniref:serine O-acetyltransferase n=1 Tax=Arthrobacter sp. SLBN-83 TaxID=2768449 RepID=UPI003FA4228E
MGLPPKWRWRYHITQRIAVFIRLLRICEHYRSKTGLGRLIYFVYRFRFERVSEALGFDIPLGTFAPGLSIAHRGPIIVNGNARVGRNCRIHPGVTIGAVRGQCPTIGDDVFIGPNVGIYGPINVGNGAVLGPSSLINFNVAEGQTTFGPRAVIKSTPSTAKR